VTRWDSGRTLRARLTLLYTCLFLVLGAALLVIADLPVLTFGSAGPAGTHRAHVRSVSNLPNVLFYSGIALAVLAVLAVALGWLMAGRVLRPLRAITATARSISASNLDERLSLEESYDSYQEFRELGETLDELFGRLEAAFESQRHFVANASHELRTPLAAERAVIQVALADPDASTDSLRAACQQLLALGEQQERLIDALLTLASSQRGLNQRVRFDLAELTSRIVRARGDEAARHGVRVETRLDHASVAGDPSLVESLVANLVDNAIRHNVPGGFAEVTTMADGDLTVANTGAVIPPGEVDRLFQPFQQLTGERTRTGGGHGLGLAIVAAIASAHGAPLTARARPEGGLAITVSFARDRPY
jgi:signal transduction histidine kinase